MRPSSYNIIVPLPGSEDKLIFHGVSGAVDLVQPQVADLLSPRNRLSPRPGKTVMSQTLRALARRGYLTEKSRDQETAYAAELGTRVHRVLRRHAPPGVLAVPSYSCNLRCTYCYEKPLQGKGPSWLSKRMSLDTATSLFDAVEKLRGEAAPPRSLTFYGGEPFQEANTPVIRHLFHKARDKGFRSFSGITNGVELNRFKDLLGPDGRIGFLQITLDGPREVHDRRRFLPGGQGTFETIAANISMALDRGVRVSVRMNIDRDNADAVGAARAFFQEQGWEQTRLFRAYCSPVHAGGCSRPAARTFPSHLEMERAVEKGLKPPPSGPADSSLLVDSLTHSIRKRILSHLEQDHGLPRWRTAFCGSNMSMYIFDPFGDIYPCWEVIGQLKHRIGTYGPRTVALDERTLRAWHHRSVTEISACRSCAYLFFCGGGCEAFALQKTGRADRPLCLDFPRHFERAAVQAFQDWQTRKKKEAP
jgi:uncharacterized protein